MSSFNLAGFDHKFIVIYNRMEHNEMNRSKMIANTMARYEKVTADEITKTIDNVLTAQQLIQQGLTPDIDMIRTWQALSKIIDRKNS